MLPESATVRAQAISWHIRLRDGRAQDWEEFSEWLALDPRHSTTYDEVALGDREIEPVLVNWASSRTALANDNWSGIESPTVSRRWVIGGLAAAGVAAALLLLNPMTLTPSATYDVATAPGEQRIVMLGSHDRVALNGGTRIHLDRSNPRFASLDYGEAAFHVVHDPKSPFVLQLGEDRVEDIGTVFNVTTGPLGHTIEVAEGGIVYNTAGERIELVAGQALTSNSRERRITLSRKLPTEVGGWQHGRLSYRASPLSVVAADVSRSLGTPVTVQPGIANRSFTGTIEIDRDESRMFPRLAELLDVDASRSKDGWMLGPAKRPKH